MFTISNPKKVGDLSFTTAKGRPVTLRPGRSLEFENDQLNDGLLRTMVGTGSYYRVLADGDDAQAMIDAALARKLHKRAGSPIVHGSTEPPDYQRGRDRPLEIRDLKATKAEAAPEGGDKDKPGQDPPAPAPAPPPAPVTPGVFIREEETKREPSPAEKLLAVVEGKPWNELVTEAKEVLGDRFPEGRPGRKVIKEALEASIAAAEVPQQQAAE